MNVVLGQVMLKIFLHALVYYNRAQKICAKLGMVDELLTECESSSFAEL